MLSFEIHSPEQEIFSPLYENKQVRVFIKRDDLIHPFISGNKWRKLKYHLIEAQKLNKDTLFTFGGAWSNHLLATACAGALFGLKTKACVRGEKVQNPVLTMCQLYGMELHFITREEYKNKEKLSQSIADENTMVIHEGGYGPLALDGCAEIWDELVHAYDHLILACGTGTTLAGLQKGKVERQLQTQLHGVPVLKGGTFIREEINHLAVKADDILLHLDYHFGGYAKCKPELLTYIQNFVSSTGILIEPTYTGKLFFAVDNLIEKDYFTPNDNILLIHTGGITGLLGHHEKFTNHTQFKTNATIA